MKELRNIALMIAAILVAATVYAQSVTTYNLQVPTACGVYSAMYDCNPQVVTTIENNAMHYAPHSGYPFGYIYFSPGTTVLGDLGFATIDSVKTTLLSSIDNGKKPNTQGYIKWTNYSEATTFHEQVGNPIAYTGNTSLLYTTTTQCCSSGRGASEHTVWTITGGTVIISQ